MCHKVNHKPSHEISPLEICCGCQCSWPIIIWTGEKCHSTWPWVIVWTEEMSIHLVFLFITFITNFSKYLKLSIAQHYYIIIYRIFTCFILGRFLCFTLNGTFLHISKNKKTRLPDKEMWKKNKETKHVAVLWFYAKDQIDLIIKQCVHFRNCVHPLPPIVHGYM